MKTIAKWSMFYDIPSHTWKFCPAIVHIAILMGEAIDNEEGTMRGGQNVPIVPYAISSGRTLHPSEGEK